MGRVAMRCVESTTRKAIGANSWRLSLVPPWVNEDTPMSDIQKARKALISLVLEGNGETSASERRAAFNNTGVAKPLSTLVDKVARQAYRVTDDDIAAARGS